MVWSWSEEVRCGKRLYFRTYKTMELMIGIDDIDSLAGVAG